MLFMQVTSGGPVPKEAIRWSEVFADRSSSGCAEKEKLMAVEGRINVRHEDVFTQPVLLLSVDPVEDFDKKRAGVADPQERDKTTEMRLWSVSVLDPTAQQGKREVKVKIAADVQP